MKLFSNGHEIDVSDEKFGELRSSNDILNDFEKIRQRMEEDGYIYIKKFFDPELVLDARREILYKYAIAGEIDIFKNQLMDAIYSENTAIDKVNLIAFDESIRNGKSYLDLVESPVIKSFFKKFFDVNEVSIFDFKWVRFLRNGEGCGFHCDSVYVCRSTYNVYSSWIPIGNVSKEEGPLIVLENSHKNEKLKETYGRKDADKEKLGWLSTNPNTLQKRLGGRWLTTDFKAGDIIIFNVFLVHGTLDNNSPINRCRLTTDIRYQPAQEPLDERWNGDRFKLGGNVNPHGEGKRAFLTGLDRGKNNVNFTEEWKSVDEFGRIVQ